MFGYPYQAPPVLWDGTNEARTAVVTASFFDWRRLILLFESRPPIFIFTSVLVRYSCSGLVALLFPCLFDGTTQKAIICMCVMCGWVAGTKCMLFPNVMHATTHKVYDSIAIAVQTILVWKYIEDIDIHNKSVNFDVKFKGKEKRFQIKKLRLQRKEEIKSKVFLKAFLLP